MSLDMHIPDNKFFQDVDYEHNLHRVSITFCKERLYLPQRAIVAPVVQHRQMEVYAGPGILTFKV